MANRQSLDRLQLIALGLGWALALIALGTIAARTVPPSELPRATSVLGSTEQRYAFARWDAVYYRTVAEHGYRTLAEASFYPGAPLLTRAVHTVLPVGWYELGAGLSTLCFFLGLWLMLQLRVVRAAGQRAAVVLFALAAPTSFFFLAPYSEGLFWLLTALTLWALERRPRLGIISAALGTVTRPYGIILAIPVAMALWQRRQRWLAVATVGLCSTLLITTITWVSHQVGTSLAPLVSQHNAFERSLGLGPSELTDLLRAALNGNGPSWLLLVNVTVGLAAIGLAIGRMRKLLGLGWVVATALLIAAGLGLGLVHSSNRFFLSFAPVIVTLALTLRGLTKTAALVFGTVLLLVNSLLFSLWYFVA